MFASAVMALVIGVSANNSPWLLLPLILAYAITVPADSGALTSGMTMAADPNYRGATMAIVRPGASACRRWAHGARCRARRCRRPARSHRLDGGFCGVGGGHPDRSGGALLVETAACVANPLLARKRARDPDDAQKNPRRPTIVNERQLPIILALGTTQTLAWASSYYLPAILADPIARDLGLSSNWIFAAFSAALVISGMIGPRVGRKIDLMGGRGVLSTSNVVFALGLVLLGTAHSLAMLALAWLALGIGMGLGLYDAAFGALGRIYGDTARRAITGITLLAGFASTIGWPLTAWGLETIGWRGAAPPGMGRGAHHHRIAAEPADASTHHDNPCRYGTAGQTTYPDRPHHDPARADLRRPGW